MEIDAGTKSVAKASYPAWRLERYPDNPVLEPRPELAWEAKSVFNSAAISLDGRVHLLYRTTSDDDISYLGYAASGDGFKFDVRPTSPAYWPRESFEGVSRPHPHLVSLSPYASGGIAGGCEDPRLTLIDNRLYLTYVAYNGSDPPRLAISSIAQDDFLAQRWNWRRPVLISRPGIVDKNPALFPEKIRGRYVLLHRVFPDILLDFLDDLDFDGHSRWLRGEYRLSSRPGKWDSRKCGAGPPPIKTEFGWLLIYHGVDDADEGRYKIGAMLLDLDDPTRIIARFDKPILEPGAEYENVGWKSGVVYPCGAVVLADRLVVYYGGADRWLCAASSPLNKLLDALMSNSVPLGMEPAE